MPEIRVENLFFTYPNRFRKKGERALNGFSAVFEGGKFNVIIGSSGAGKTTLLRILLGLEDKYQGGIAFGGVNADKIPAGEREIGYVSQELALYPRYTIFQNIAFPLRNVGANDDEIRSRVFRCAERLGIKELLSRKPKELSVGQNQRVAIARALIREPRYCFFDEPFSNLDQAHAKKIQGDLKRIFQERDTTVLYVTHSIPEAIALADRLYLMEEGKLLLDGSAQEVFGSPDPAVQAYFQELRK